MTYERRPLLVVFREDAAFKDTYGGALGTVALSCQHLVPERASDTVLVFMHPIGGLAWLPVIGAFAAAGLHVIAADSRYRGTDSALIMEKVALDLGAVVRHAKERLGYARVVLAGWSGGGSLSLFYQAEAERPTVTHTPAGDPCPLADAGLIPADAVLLLAAHRARHLTLTEWIDPSIVDEADSEARDPALWLYGPAAPQPPYAPDFLEAYRAAQVARNRRITAWVKEQLGRLRANGRPHDERAFTVHGTMADPRWLDPSIDPNGRKARWCYLGDPAQVNDGPVGLARFCTLRSWLSQWSYDDARADGLACAARVSVPVLVVSNGADDACTPDQGRSLFDAVAHGTKALVTIEGANHYYLGQPELAGRAVETCRAWLAERGMA